MALLMHFKEFTEEIKRFNILLDKLLILPWMYFDSRFTVIEGHNMEVKRYYKEHYYFSDSDDNDVIVAESNNNTLDRLDST